MNRTAMLAVAGLLALAGCGDSDSGASGASSPGDDGAAEKDDTATKKDAVGLEQGQTAAAARKGTTVTLGRSEFGSMLFGSSRQAIYVFQNDRKGKSVCYGECAEA